MLGNNKRNKIENISIFEKDETDDENEKIQNIEISKQQMTKLMKNEFINFIKSKNPQNNNDQIVSINQKIRIFKIKNILDQSTRRSTRFIKLYNRYKYNNQKNSLL